MGQFDYDINVTLFIGLIARGRAEDAQADDPELVSPILLELRECL